MLTAVFGVFALVLLLSGLVGRQRRVSSWTGAVAAGSAAFAAYHDAFWPMVILAMFALGAAFASIELFDLGWRLRFSLTAAVAGLAFLVSPTGRTTMPVWVDHVGSSGTVHATGDLAEVALVPPPQERMPQIVRSETSG